MSVEIKLFKQHEIVSDGAKMKQQWCFVKPQAQGSNFRLSYSTYVQSSSAEEGLANVSV